MIVNFICGFMNELGLYLIKQIIIMLFLLWGITDYINDDLEMMQKYKIEFGP